MAQSADVTDPDEPKFPPDSNLVNDLIVTLLYDTTLLHHDPSSLDLLSPVHNSTKARQAAEAHQQFMDRLRLYMVQGKYVLVRGWNPDLTVTWDTKSIQALKGSCNQQVEYQGNHVRFYYIPAAFLWGMNRCCSPGKVF